MYELEVEMKEEIHDLVIHSFDILQVSPLFEQKFSHSNTHNDDDGGICWFVQFTSRKNSKFPEKKLSVVYF